MSFLGIIGIMAVILFAMLILGIKFEGSRDGEKSGKAFGFLVFVFGAIFMILIHMMITRIYGLEPWMGYIVIAIAIYFLTTLITAATSATVAFLTGNYSFSNVLSN